MNDYERDIICPVCNEKINLKFDKIEINQKGKNICCPFCNYCLWIPLEGDPQPVPLINYMFYPSLKSPQQYLTSLMFDS